MRIAVIPGDGVGPEVTGEAVKVLGAIGRAYGLAIESETLPYGADYYLQTGTRLLLTLLLELRRRGKRRGLATACIGGGQGIAAIVETL
jgi:isocitrate/isopropylmalate dehydrogenase